MYLGDSLSVVDIRPLDPQNGEIDVFFFFIYHLVLDILL